MKAFLCVLAALAVQGEAVGDIDRLVELLNRRTTKAHAQTLRENLHPKLESKETQPEHVALTGFQRCNFIEDYFPEFFTIPAVIDMIDKTDYRPEMLTFLETTMESFRGMDDYEALALLSTRKIAKILFMDRLRCPATVLERFIINVMKRELGEQLEGENSMVSKLVPVLNRIPHIETSAITPERLAHLMARETHGHVYNDTIGTLLFWSMRDVSGFAEMTYRKLRREWEDIMTLQPAERSNYLEELLKNKLSRVYCPSFQEVGNRHFQALWELANGLRDIEAHEVCWSMTEFIRSQVPELTYIHGDDLTAFNTVLRESCHIINGYLMEVVELLEKLEKASVAGEPSDFLDMAKPYFSEEELKILEQALEKIDMPMPVLTIADVITHEEDDVKHWNSLLEVLTPEKFQAMTIDDFVTLVNDWIQDKQGRIEMYKNYHPQSLSK